MCGDPYTMTRRKSKEPQTFCTQCTHIFKKKTVVKPEKRAAKIKQIRLRQKVRGLLAKLSSLLFPGAGQIYFGYPIKGVLLSFFFYLATVSWLLKGYSRVLLDTGGKTIFSWPTLMLLILFLGGSYILNLRDILKLSPKNQ
jgi:TM2 domain-containing membrane protein YozV